MDLIYLGKMNYKKIEKENLAEVLEFLAKGFKWRLNRVEQIRRYIIKSNKNLEFYGFASYDKSSNICSAILTPLQGSYSSKFIINLMSWYSLPHYRGMKSILFIQYLTRYLIKKNFIITDYTPTQVVSKILKNIGFKLMGGFKKYKKFVIINPFKLIILICSGSKISRCKSKKTGEFKISFMGDGLKYKFCKGNINFTFVGNIKIISKKYFGLRIKIKSFQILWTDNEKDLLKHWEIICYMLLVNLKTLFISADFFISNNFPKEGNKKIHPIKYLIYDSENVLSFMPSIGSELSLSNFD